MDKSLWIAMGLIVIGTFSMRALPLLWMSRRINESQNENIDDNIPVWLSVMGPVMIAAMLGVSLVPSTQNIMSWGATIFAGLITLLLWSWKKSLGLPVFAGVFIYGIIVYFLTY